MMSKRAQIKITLALLVYNGLFKCKW